MIFKKTHLKNKKYVSEQSVLQGRENICSKGIL